MKYQCPVCGWDGLDDNPDHHTFEICACCGCEFGYSDATLYPQDRPARLELLRKDWIEYGMKFWADQFSDLAKYNKKPDNWNPKEQVNSLKKTDVNTGDNAA